MSCSAGAGRDFLGGRREARTGIFIGGKDIHLAMDVTAAAQKAMVPPFDISVFADPGGSYTTAAALVACVESVLKRHYSRGLKGLRVAVFGATGVVGFASGVIAAREGAVVRMVAHDTLEPLIQQAAMAKEHFGADLVPVEGQNEQAKAKIVREADVIFTCRAGGREYHFAQAHGAGIESCWSRPTSTRSSPMASRAWTSSWTGRRFRDAARSAWARSPSGT